MGAFALATKVSSRDGSKFTTEMWIGSDEFGIGSFSTRGAKKDTSAVYEGYKHKIMGVKNGPSVELWALLG
eukprot:1160503-Pelagomonas_calceolata.AAC.2